MSYLPCKYKIEGQCCVPICNVRWHILSAPVEYNPFGILYKSIYNIKKVFYAPVWPLTTTDYFEVVCVIILHDASILSFRICSAVFCYRYDYSILKLTFDIEPEGYKSSVFSIKALISLYFIGMLYDVIKYSTISNNIVSMNLERILCTFFTAFSFVDLNNIDIVPQVYLVVVFHPLQSHNRIGFLTQWFKIIENSLQWDRNVLVFSCIFYTMHLNIYVNIPHQHSFQLVLHSGIVILLIHLVAYQDMLHIFLTITLCYL